MTARGTATHGKSPALARAATGRGKARPAHTTHERQAEAAGAAFARGETGIGARLTSAPAARFRLPGSVPRPLPGPLRGQLEQAYAADLSGLHLFDDAPAHAAARAFGAHAFAAGADLYFGAGAWQPDRADGRARIAHEVAHALQQAGRAASAGRMRLERGVEGEAGVQRDMDTWAHTPVGKALVNLLPPVDAAHRLDVLLRHTLQPPGRIDAGLASQLRSAIAKPDAAAATAAIDDILRSLVAAQRTPPTLELFFDLYKSLGQDAKARALFDKETPTSTAFGSGSFYYQHRLGDAAWIADRLHSHPLVGRYFPNAILRAARLDFLGLLDTPTRLSSASDFDATLTRAINLAHDYNPTMPEERTLAALVAFRQFEMHRRKRYFARTREWSSVKSPLTRFEMGRAMVALYASPGRLVEDAREDKQGPEVERIATDVGRLLAPIAERTGRFWDAVDKLRGDLLPDKKHPPQFLQHERMEAEVASRLPGIPALRKLGEELAPSYAQALKLDAGQVPDDDTQKSNRAIAANRTLQVVQTLEERVVDENAKTYGDPASGDTDVTVPDAAMSNAIVQGAVILALDVLHALLETYTPEKIPQDSGRTDLAGDRALAHFIRVAEILAGFAHVIGLAGLSDSTRDIQLARGDTPPASSIGLLAPFALQPATLTEFSREFSHGAFYKNGTLTDAQMIEWAFVMYHEDLVVELGKALAQTTPLGLPREYDSDPDAEPVLNTAMKQVWKHGHLPRRYRVPRGATIRHVHAKDVEKAGLLVPDDHPLALELMRYLHAGEFIVTPGHEHFHLDGFVAWALPDMEPLARAFAAIPGVVDLVAPDGKKLGPVAAAESGTAWLLRLNSIVGMDPKLRAALSETVHAREVSAVKALEPLYRRATNNQRKRAGRLIAQEWEDLPATFLTDTTKYDSSPRQAFKFTSQFLMGVLPDRLSERRLQMTALMLELAPVMSRRLKGKDRLDILLALHGDLAGAAAFARSDAYAKEREWLLTGLDGPATLERAVLLQALADDFRETAEGRQAKRDLRADADTNELKVLHSRFSVEGGQGDPEQPPESATFMANGIVYTLNKIHRSFKYEPELLSKESAVDWGKTIPLGAARLWIEGREHFETDAAVPLLRLTKFAHDREQTLEITSRDTAALSELTWAVHQHFTGKDLEALGGVLDSFGHALITAMQVLFPEFATEMAYAEIAMSIVKFFGDPEFRELAGALDNDSGGLFENSLGGLRQAFDPEGLWDWFLMGSKMPAGFAALVKTGNAIGRLRMVGGHGGDEKTKSAVGKVLRRLFNVGKVVLDDVDRVHKAVEFPVKQFALFVQGSPVLQKLLRLAAHELEKMESLSLQALADQAGTDLRGEVRDVYLNLLHIIEGLSAFELPKELIPLHEIIEMVVNMVIDALPSKYSYPIRTSRKVDAVESLFQWIFNKVADLMIEHGLDPNRVWQKFAADLVNPLLKDAGEAISSTAKEMLDSVPGISELKAWSGVEEPAPQVSFRSEDGANQTASPKTEVPGAVPAARPSLPLAGGRPLDSSSLVKAERGYGHDFRHVRVHEGGDVDRALRRSGALAATSGSHVYLDSARRHEPDLLSHELAHVLQQGGPRPLGSRHSTSPMHASAPGGGWRVDAADEAQADALADQAREPASAPRRVRSAAGAAIQPKFDLQGILGKFFSEVGDPAKLQASADQLGRKKLDNKALQQAAPELRKTLYDQLSEALKERATNRAVSFKAPFQLIEDLLVDYVLDNHETKLKDAMEHLLMGGLEEIGYGDKRKPSTFWIVNPNHLKVQIQQYFFAVTGVSVEIEFKLVPHVGEDKKQRKTVAATKSFSKIRFVHLHLPAIGGGAKLWNEIMKNSFPKLSDDDISKTKLRVRRAMASLPPDPGLYDGRSGKLKLGKKAMEAVEKEFIGGLTSKLDPNLIPTWKEYVDPDAKTKQVAGKETGQLGLRMGFYKDRGKLDGQRGTDRESHHTVQYLLMEYFSNTLPKRPFPSPLALYPSVKGKGKEVEMIARNPGDTSGIKIEMGSSRGPNMPTLLLAKSTHKSPVHVTPGGDEETSSPSQSGTVHEWFSGYLGEYRDLVLNSAHSSKLKALAAVAASKKSTAATVQFKNISVTPLSLANAIHDATNKTYNKMRADMNISLGAQIDKHERKYYTDVVAQATAGPVVVNGKPGPAYRPAAALLKDTVVPVVQRRQREAFDKTFGFKTTGA